MEVENRINIIVDEKIPDGWEEKLIEDFCLIKRGASPRPINSSIWFDSDSKIGWIRISDVTSSNKYLKKTSQYLSDKGIEKSLPVHKGDLILSICATVGIPIILDMNACIHDGFVLFNNLDDEQIYKDFLYYVLCHIQEYLNKKGQSGTQVNLNTGLINNTPIILPKSLPEQKKIAEILTCLDNTIEKTEQLIEKMKNMKKGLMHDLFTRGVDENGQLRPPYEEASHLYKESELGWIPKEWEVEKTKEVSEKIWIGLVTTMTKYYVQEGVKLIRNNNIRDSEINDYDIINLDLIFSEINKNRYLYNGDIVTVHTGDIGTSAIITDKYNKSHGFATINTRVNKDKLVNNYLCEYYNSNIYKSTIQKYATGDGRGNFNLYDYIELYIPYPKKKYEQEQIIYRIKAMRDKIQYELKYLNKLKKLKQGLMEDLLTGKVRVTSLLKKEEAGV